MKHTSQWGEGVCIYVTPTDDLLKQQLCCDTNISQHRPLLTPGRNSQAHRVALPTSDELMFWSVHLRSTLLARGMKSLGSQRLENWGNNGFLLFSPKHPLAPTKDYLPGNENTEETLEAARTWTVASCWWSYCLWVRYEGHLDLIVRKTPHRPPHVLHTDNHTRHLDSH